MHRAFQIGTGNIKQPKRLSVEEICVYHPFRLISNMGVEQNRTIGRRNVTAGLEVSCESVVSVWWRIYGALREEK